MMYKVRTSIDDERKARMIARYIVESEAAVSVHIRRVETIYQWKGEVVEDIEWELESLTTCPSEVATIVKGMHSYELGELITEKTQGSDAIEQWCLDWCKKQE